MHQLVLSIELGTVQTGNGKVDSAQKFKYTTAACEPKRGNNRIDLYIIETKINK